MTAISRASLLEFLRGHRYAVEASAGALGGAQAAVVGIAVSDQFHLVFDTLESTRKAKNLVRDPRVAFVVGGLSEGEGRTVQYEGVADRPGGPELEAIRELYFGTFPDGRERLAWQGLIHLRVVPTWLRYSDYLIDPPVIVELSADELARLR